VRFGGLRALIAIHLYVGNLARARKASGAQRAFVTGGIRTLNAIDEAVVHADQPLAAILAYRRGTA